MRASRRRPAALVVVIDGHRFEIEVRDPAPVRAQRAGGAGEGVQTVAAPMPGKVVRVLAARRRRGGARGRGSGGGSDEDAERDEGRRGPVRCCRSRSQEGATVAAGEILATIE